MTALTRCDIIFLKDGEFMKFIDWLPVLCAIISILGSYITAKITAKNEFKQLTLQQRHEIKINSIKSFAELKAAINAYTTTPNIKYQREAIAATGKFIPYASDNLIRICHSLEISLRTNDLKGIANYVEQLDAAWKLEQPTEKNNNSRC